MWPTIARARRERARATAAVAERGGAPDGLGALCSTLPHLARARGARDAVVGERVEHLAPPPRVSDAVVRGEGRRRALAEPSAARPARGSTQSVADGRGAPRARRRIDYNDVRVLSCASVAAVERALAGADGDGWAGAAPACASRASRTPAKSSLLNHLLRKKNLARASSAAGKTRAVDLLLANGRLVLADLPGLPSRDGQARKQWDAQWRALEA